MGGQYGYKCIYATGVYLRPVKVADKWQWIAFEFEGESFDEYGDCYNPLLSADTVDELEKGITSE